MLSNYFCYNDFAYFLLQIPKRHWHTTICGKFFLSFGIFIRVWLQFGNINMHSHKSLSSRAPLFSPTFPIYEYPLSAYTCGCGCVDECSASLDCSFNWFYKLKTNLVNNKPICRKYLIQRDFIIIVLISCSCWNFIPSPFRMHYGRLLISQLEMSREI